MNFPFFSLGRARARSRAARSQASIFASLPVASAVERQHSNSSLPRNGTTPDAIWRVNAETGRLECHWTCDSEEIAAWYSLSWFDRFGLVLAVSQRNRVSSWVH